MTLQATPGQKVALFCGISWYDVADVQTFGRFLVVPNPVEPTLLTTVCFGIGAYKFDFKESLFEVGLSVFPGRALPLLWPWPRNKDLAQKQSPLSIMTNVATRGNMHMHV